MPDELFSSMPEGDRQVGATLRALPLVAPRRSVFAELEHELTGTLTQDVAQPKRLRGAWIALAASFVAALVGVRLFHPQPEANSVQPTAAASDTQDLIAQSQRLDSMLAMLDARSVPVDAGTAMASAELEDLIGLTDAQLNAAEREDEVNALWTRRVDLMSRLAATRAGSSLATFSDQESVALYDAGYTID